MYSLSKRILFKLEPERAHALALKSIQTLHRSGLSKFFFKTIPSNPIEIMGLSFPNRVGLSAGFDRNGEYLNALSALGFGFIEIGTIVPEPQSGNDKPRIFRVVDDEALINRVGFASKGMDYVAEQLKNSDYQGILGINIGKNKKTPNEEAAEDYLKVFHKLWKYASYITINISSPNTPGLRDLQSANQLAELLKQLKIAQREVKENYEQYVPLVVKISPDQNDADIEEMAQVFLQNRVDGVIATNTTLARDIRHSELQKETGGLSGRPLADRSTAVITLLHSILKERIPIIASGGVMDVATAEAKLAAGAKLLEIYTGFIYRGPKLISELAALPS